MHPAQASPSELVVSLPSAATRRPSVRSPPKRRLTCPRVRTPPRPCRGAHLTRVSALSGPGTRPGIRPVIRHGQRRASHLVPVSCCLSATGVRLSGHPVPARELGLPHGRLTRHTRPDPDGVTTFRTCETRPGWVPSLPRGRRCSPRPDAVPGRRLPLPSGQSLHPAPTSHQRGSVLRGINEGSRDSPVRPAPGLWPPGWDGQPLGFPLCSAPRRYRQRTTGRGRALSTHPELRGRHSRPSNPRVPSQGATSCRNGRTGHCPGETAMNNHPAGPVSRERALRQVRRCRRPSGSMTARTPAVIRAAVWSLAWAVIKPVGFAASEIKARVRLSVRRMSYG